MSKMKFIDLFCGIGGFRMGFENNGFECVFSSDYDKECQLTYESNFNELPFGDITKITPAHIPDFDVLLAGFPCQPFSISGKKMGFEDTRGTLFFDVCRIIKDKNPKVVVLENVQHLVHHDRGNTFKVIQAALGDLGFNVTTKLLNSNQFGLPQHRERIFIVGSKRGYFDFDKMIKTKAKPLESFLDKKGDFEYLKKDEYTLIDTPKKQPYSGLIFVGYRNKNGFTKGIRPGTQHLSRVHRQPNRIYSIRGYHPTLPSQEPSGRFFIYNPQTDRVRRLTIDECYKIMGFPKTFKKHSNMSVCYRQIGNSVSVNVIDELAKQIITQKLLKDEPRRKVVGDLRELLYA